MKLPTFTVGEVSRMAHYIGLSKILYAEWEDEKRGEKYIEIESLISLLRTYSKTKLHQNYYKNYTHDVEKGDIK